MHSLQRFLQIGALAVLLPFAFGVPVGFSALALASLLMGASFLVPETHLRVVSTFRTGSADTGSLFLAKVAGATLLGLCAVGLTAMPGFTHGEIDLASIARLTPFSPQANYMSLEGYVQVLYLNHYGRRISRSEARSLLAGRRALPAAHVNASPAFQTWSRDGGRRFRHEQGMNIDRNWPKYVRLHGQNHLLRDAATWRDHGDELNRMGYRTGIVLAPPAALAPVSDHGRLRVRVRGMASNQFWHTRQPNLLSTYVVFVDGKEAGRFHDLKPSNDTWFDYVGPAISVPTGSHSVQVRFYRSTGMFRGTQRWGRDLQVNVAPGQTAWLDFATTNEGHLDSTLLSKVETGGVSSGR